MMNITDIITHFENRTEEGNVKAPVLQKLFRRWSKSYSDLNIDPKKTMSLLRKQSSLKDTPEELQHVYKECLSRDITSLLKTCFAFYTKKHKFTLNDEDKMIIENISPETLENGISVFKNTIGPLEGRYGLFTKRNTKQKKNNDGAPRKLGEFNLFVKEQWATRKDELSALCKDKKGSSSVMKQLANEWKLEKAKKTATNV